MKNPLCSFLILLTVFCLLGAGIRSFAAEADSPNLKAAVEALEAAKIADDPLPSLQEAMKDLDKATNNALNKRDEATDAVTNAISLAKDGNKTEMTDKINHAIALLHMGMSKGGRRRN